MTSYDEQISNFIKKIFICVEKINKSLTGLDRHESDRIFIFM